MPQRQQPTGTRRWDHKPSFTLARGVDLVGACYSTGLVDLIYTNEQSDKMFIINLSHFPSDDGTPVELSGGLVGHVVELPNSKGGSSYLIQFEKAGWTYSVAATLGKNYGLPDNTVTPDELKAVAISIAER